MSEVVMSSAVLGISVSTGYSSKVAALTSNNTFLKVGILSSSNQICKRNFNESRLKDVVVDPSQLDLVLPKKPIRIMEKI